MAATAFCINFKIPIPPSVNSLYDGGKNTARRFKSDGYKAWCVQAGRFVSAYLADYRKSTGHEFVTIRERVRVTYRFAEFDDNRRRDVANYEKATSDLLVDHGIIDDDCLIYKNTQEWADDLPEGMAEIYVENL